MLTAPTAEQCGANAKVYDDDGTVGYAIWYPQMGGYIGKAVAMIDKDWEEYANGAAMGGCINVWVWHDGEFPFADGEQQPICVHHCEPEQFVEFGNALLKLNNQHRKGE